MNESLENASNEVPLPQVNIGYGFDLVNSSFDRSTFKARVFEVSNNEIIFDTRSNEMGTIEAGKTIEEITDKASGTFGLNVNGFKPFSLDIKAKFESKSEQKGTDKYAFIWHSYEKCAETFADCSIPRIKQLLRPEFKEWINNPAIAPNKIVESYGTHVIASGVVHGARFNGYLVFRDSQNLTKDTFGANMATRIFSFKASGSVSLSNEEKILSDNTSYVINQKGGKLPGNTFIETNPAKDFNFWHDSIMSDGALANDIISIGTLYGVWELADDDNRALEIKEYVQGLTTPFFTDDGGRNILALGFMKKPSLTEDEAKDWKIEPSYAARLIKEKFKKIFAHDEDLRLRDSFHVEMVQQCSMREMAKIYTEDGQPHPQGDGFITNRDEFVFMILTNYDIKLDIPFIPRIYELTIDNNDEKMQCLSQIDHHNYPHHAGSDPRTW